MRRFRAALAVALGSPVTALFSLAVAVPAHAEDYFIGCPSGHSGIATTVTSCPFAENVRQAYLSQDGMVVTAYSPVTNQYYDMQCAPGFIAHLRNGPTVPSVRCVGGDNALVIIF